MGFIWDLHAIWRWVLLAAGAVVVLRALIGWLGRRPWTRLDDQLGMIYTMAVDIQFLIGLILWFVEPFNVRHLPVAMSNPLLRFYLLEHPILMLVALVLAHIGRGRSHGAGTDVKKHRIAFIFYGLSLLVIVLIFIMRLSIR